MLTTRPKRKEPPLAVKLAVALRQLAAFLGCQPDELDLDHTPALGLRPVAADGKDYDPPQHHPDHLEYLSRPRHSAKTNGRRGESDLSLDSNSDKARIAKAKRLEQSRPTLLSHESRTKEDRPKPKHSWPQGRKLQSRNTFKRKTDARD